MTKLKKWDKVRIVGCPFGGDVLYFDKFPTFIGVHTIDKTLDCGAVFLLGSYYAFRPEWLEKVEDETENTPQEGKNGSE